MAWTEGVWPCDLDGPGFSTVRWLHGLREPRVMRARCLWPIRGRDSSQIWLPMAPSATRPDPVPKSVGAAQSGEDTCVPPIWAERASLSGRQLAVSASHATRGRQHALIGRHEACHRPPGPNQRPAALRRSDVTSSGPTIQPAKSKPLARRRRPVSAAGLNSWIIDLLCPA